MRFVGRHYIYLLTISYNCIKQEFVKYIIRGETTTLWPIGGTIYPSIFCCAPPIKQYPTCT